MLNKLSKKGGHLGSNFGVVELEIAMHFVFDSPIDKFIFDVSHQTYPHKILTGRKNSFIDEKSFDLISGYTNINENEHDMFTIGHTSTSISLASGIAKSRDLKKEKFNVVAIIGDGSLSGGEAMEGLNVVGSELKSNFIIIVNDNDMFVAESYGAISNNLKKLRETKGSFTNNIFKSFGFDYIYEDNGNDIESLIKTLKKIKNIDHPIVLHVKTEKGHGYDYAVKDKEYWHWCEPFDVVTGDSKNTYDSNNYYNSLNQFVMNRAKVDENFLFITPSYPCVLSLSKEQRDILKDKYVDVGIAEEQAVAMASGASKNGSNVLMATDSSFIQRTYDQISQELCLNKIPATILLHYTFEGIEESTHLGIFSQSIFLNVPNLLVLAPTSNEELIDILDWSLSQKEYPVMIFVPRGKLINKKTNFISNKKYVVEKKGEKIAVFAVGGMYKKAISLIESIKKELNIDATLINPIFISEMDYETLNELKSNTQIIITLEDSCKSGGFGEKIAEFFSDSNIKVKCYGAEKIFYNKFDVDKIFNETKNSNEEIVKYIKMCV